MHRKRSLSDQAQLPIKMWKVSPRKDQSASKSAAGQHAVRVVVAGGEPARAGKSPAGGDLGDGRAVAVFGGAKLLVGPVQADPAQIGPRGGVQMTAEC